MKEKFKKLNIGGKLILISTLVAILSLFFNWINLKGLSIRGYNQSAYIFLLLFIYPLYIVIFNKKMDNFTAYVFGIFANVVGIGYIGIINRTFLESEFISFGLGIYIYLASTFLLLFGIFNYKKVK